MESEVILEFLDLLIPQDEFIIDLNVDEDSLIVKKNRRGIGFYRGWRKGNQVPTLEVLSTMVSPNVSLFNSGCELQKISGLENGVLIIYERDLIGLHPSIDPSYVSNKRALINQILNKIKKVYYISNSPFVKFNGIRRSKASFFCNFIDYTVRRANNIHIIDESFSGLSFFAEVDLCKPEEFSNIIDNYRNKQNSKIKKLGYFIEYDEFRSFEYFDKSERLELLVKRSRWSPKSLSDVIIDTKFYPKGVFDIDNLDFDNTIIIKLNNIQEMFTVYEFSKLEIKRNLGYVLFKLDSSKVIAQYFIYYFTKTDIGSISKYLLFDNRRFGPPRLVNKEFNQLEVYFPPIDDQLEILALNNNINEYHNLLNELNYELWKSNVSIRRIREKIEPFLNINSVSDWIDTLPYPLSSIIWRVEAEQKYEIKNEGIMKFFEAFPQFVFALLYSGLKDNYNINLQITELSTGHGSIKNTTFGFWNQLYANLAKQLRKKVKEEKQLVISQMGDIDEGLFNQLISKDLISIVDEVRELRNNWIGHAGVSDGKTQEMRYQILYAHLNKLREKLSYSFKSCQVLLPGSCNLNQGVYKYSVRLLRGSRTPFAQISLDSNSPMDTSKLYVMHIGSKNPICLLPVIKFQDEGNACYYYNKISMGGSRWISFHYSEQSELNLPLSEVEQLISLFGDA